MLAAAQIWPNVFFLWNVLIDIITNLSGPHYSIDQGIIKTFEHEACVDATQLVLTQKTRNISILHDICTTSAQRLRRWSNIVQMLCKCFVITGKATL